MHAAKFVRVRVRLVDELGGGVRADVGNSESASCQYVFFLSFLPSFLPSFFLSFFLSFFVSFKIGTAAN